MFQKYKVIEEEKGKIKRRYFSGIDCISFAKASHIDSCDLIAKQRMMDMVYNDNALNGLELEKVKAYFQQINNTAGTCLTTTCGYNHCGATYRMVEVAKFAVGGFAMDLLYDRIHHF